MIVEFHAHPLDRMKQGISFNLPDDRLRRSRAPQVKAATITLMLRLVDQLEFRAKNMASFGDDIVENRAVIDRGVEA